ncbi:oligosaccharide flippase family protein [Marinobacter sp.]|uniref:lipopolysaccharide biosynthesis protein n=1 Tax=Marinobacter sp. TaxID=50741 RepID=UPI002618B791|nr:oligosaccharide flippase family protein [Marinobacter sp.]
MKIYRRIFKSELLRGSSAYLLASIATSSIPFLLLPVLTRYLTPAEYGEVAMFMVWISLLSAFCGLCVHGAASRKYFDVGNESDELAKFIFMCLLILTSTTIMFFSMVVMLASLLNDLLEISAFWLVAGVITAGLNFVIQLRLGQWQVRKEPKPYGFFQVSQALVNMSLSLFFVTVLYLGETGRLLGIVIATGIFALFSLWLLFKDKLIKVCWRPDMAKEAIGFGVPLMPHIVGMFLLNTVDRAVITAELGIDKAGIYMVAIQVSMAVSIILDAVNKAFVPWLFERLNRDNLAEKSSVVRVTYGYYCLLAFGVILSFMWADEVLLLVVGPQYVEAADLIAWIILAKGFHGGYLMVTNYLFYTKRTGILSSITITCGLINVGLLFAVINVWGLTGVAWAYCVSKFLQWLVTWFYANKQVPMPWTNFIKK